VLKKKKRECDREEEEEASMRGVERRAPVTLLPYYTCRAPVSLAPCNPPWHDPIHVYRKGTSEVDAL
jgi:hypothetical protein